MIKFIAFLLLEYWLSRGLSTRCGNCRSCRLYLRCGGIFAAAYMTAAASVCLGGTGSLSESLYWCLSVIIFKVEIRLTQG